MLSNTGVPIVLRNFVSHWSMCQWTKEKWCSIFGNKEMPFRCFKKNYISDEPIWERKCEMRNMTFRDFITKAAKSEEWMYFDYKYVHKWFNEDDEFFKEVSWKQFGHDDKGAKDSTLWIGSSGAHTPAHRDTYGYNIVAQLYGKKMWILFPPEASGLKPTRVPYEESSVYSELNFYCPLDLEAFNGLTGGRMIELAAGDALVVPKGWWHYVQNMDTVNISLNMWMPHEDDNSTQVSEALIKILVAQICKDLPQDTTSLILNPNEEDTSDTPLAVLFLQLETVTNMYLDKRRKLRRNKRQKTCDDASTAAGLDIQDLGSSLEIDEDKMETPPTVTSDKILTFIKENLRVYTTAENHANEDEIDGSTSNLCLTKAVINAFSQDNVISLIKENLFSRLI